MQLHTNAHESTEEAAITSSITGSQGKFHIGTEPQGIKGRGHSGRQNSKKKALVLGTASTVTVNTQESGKNEGKNGKAEIKGKETRDRVLSLQINGAITATFKQGCKLSTVPAEGMGPKEEKSFRPFQQLINGINFLDPNNYDIIMNQSQKKSITMFSLKTLNNSYSPPCLPKRIDTKL